MSAWGQMSLADLRASMAKLEMIGDADRIAMLSRVARIHRHRKITLSVGLAVLALVTMALPMVEARIDAWVDAEEAKAAQAWRRTP